MNSNTIFLNSGSYLVKYLHANNFSISNFELSQRSRASLKEVHGILQLIASYALLISQADFMVIEGHRTEKRQLELFNQGKSKIKPGEGKGKHTMLPAQAVDVCYMDKGKVDWHDIEAYIEIHHAFRVAATAVHAAIERKTLYRWGGQWHPGDFKNLRSSFNDRVHHEIHLDEQDECYGACHSNCEELAVLMNKKYFINGLWASN